MTEQPDTSWDREYRKTSQECIDAKAQAAGKPSPLMLPASGVGAKAFGIKRPLCTKKAIPSVRDEGGRSMSTYEELRDSTTGEGGDAWREADRLTGNLYGLYRELKEDPRYSPEHKAERAWERYEATRGKIEAGKARAKEALEKQARSAERFSIPVPAEESITTTDTAKLPASQNEASRVVRKIDRMDSNGKAGPFKPDRLEVLKTEYGRGLETGGVQGGAICRGVLDAADELGIDRHSVVDAFRKDRHRESLERAEHAERLASLIGGKVSEPPFAKPGERKRVPGQYGRGSAALLLPGRETLAPGTASRGKRRAPWK